MLMDTNTLRVDLNTLIDAQPDNSARSPRSASTNLLSNQDLQHLVFEYDGAEFDPKLLTSLELPRNLISLTINISGAIACDKMDEIRCIPNLGRKLNGLTSLKSLTIKLPTTHHMNQLIHKMPNNLINIEELDLEFCEPEENTKHCEEFYVNSCFEWIADMKNLRTLRVKSTRLNFTYCSFLKMEDLVFENLTKIELIDDLLTKGFNDEMKIEGDSWIECKKHEDLSVVFGVFVPEKIEHLELPLVFDGISGQHALTGYLELFERLSITKNLNLSIGYKLLEEDDILAISEALKTIKTKKSIEKLSLTVYYRELSKDVPAATFSLENRKLIHQNNEIAYIHYPKYQLTI